MYEDYPKNVHFHSGTWISTYATHNALCFFVSQVLESESMSEVILLHFFVL